MEKGSNTGCSENSLHTNGVRVRLSGKNLSLSRRLGNPPGM